MEPIRYNQPKQTAGTLTQGLKKNIALKNQDSISPVYIQGIKNLEVSRSFVSTKLSFYVQDLNKPKIAKLFC